MPIKGTALFGMLHLHIHFVTTTYVLTIAFRVLWLKHDQLHLARLDHEGGGMAFASQAGQVAPLRVSTVFLLRS